MEKRAPSVREDIRQTRPFRSRGQEAFLALLRTADEAKRHYAQLFEAEGITFQQYNVLRILRGAGQAGLPTLDVGNRMLERTPGVTRIADRLERKGMVCRERGMEDRRQVICRITQAGLELLRHLDAAVDRADRDIVRGLDPGRQRRLIDLLDQLREGLSEPSGATPRGFRGPAGRVSRRAPGV